MGRAWRLAERAHAGQKRMSGEPYFVHCMATAEQLAAWGMDEETVAAGLIHDVLEDTKITVEEIKKELGEEVATLVAGVTKISRIGHRATRARGAPPLTTSEQAEKLRKLILSLGQDVRIALVKLSDRLHNMKTLSFLPPAKRVKIANETAEIYAPLAYRLGMRRLSGELEDLSFPHMAPRVYEQLVKRVAKRYGERERYLEKVRPIVEKAIAEAGIAGVELSFRAKRYLSLYKKLKHYDNDLNQIYDLVAFKIMVPTIEECYRALGVIHSLWIPMAGRIKDYIANPKANGYRSLHTTVTGEDGVAVEFQIRTPEMDEEAEYGIAAHWLYKQLSPEERRRNAARLAEEAAWVRRLSNWQEGEGAEKNPVEAFKVNFLRDRIFVLTPRGRVEEMPTGATPVDFAYRVHSTLGHEAAGAKVNGVMAPLNYKLSTGDVIEILRQKGKQPSEDWLGFVVTTSARDHIKNALNRKRKRLEGVVRSRNYNKN